MNSYVFSWFQVVVLFRVLDISFVGEIIQWLEKIFVQ